MASNDDLYSLVDNIAARNQPPETQPAETTRPSNVSGNVNAETVNHWQEHPFKEQFNTANGIFSVYDPTNPDRQLFDIVEQEVIQLSSPPLKYYKLNHIQNNIDELYGEVRRKDAFNEAVTIYGRYESPGKEQELTSFGLVEVEELEIWFNYNHLLLQIGNSIQIGDVVETYDSKLWDVMTSIIIDESLWRAQHNMIRCKRMITEGVFLPGKGNISASVNIPLVKP